MEDKELGKHFEEGLEVIWSHDGRRSKCGHNDIIVSASTKHVGSGAGANT